MGKHFVATCPVCSGDLAITELRCKRCSTRIDTTLTVPPFMRLPSDLQDFVILFLKSRGNISDVEKVLGLSYPTVCKRLDQVNELLARAAPEGDERGREAPEGARRRSRRQS